MKSNIIKKLSASLFSFTLLFNSTGLVSFASNNEDVKSYLVSDVDVIGKTSVNTSVYGYDLEDNMTVNSPIIDEVTIEDSRIAVSGYIDSNDTSTYFNLSGRVYKTYDGNIVCDAYDESDKYDVVFLCLEKTQQYNDYVLYRDSPIALQNEIGDYGLKIYLMKKGTRDISILEDVDITIDNANQLLEELEETEYSNLNWFTNCFEPVTDDVASPLSDVTHNYYVYYDSDLYWFGSVYARLGLTLTATNNTPAVGTTGTTLFTANLNHNYNVDASNPSYNNPLRAEGYFRVENIGVEATIGQGYYLQNIAWNGEGASSLSASLSLSAYIGISGRYGGASISISPTTVSFQKNNWCNLVTNYVNNNTVPRRASTTFTNLKIATPSHYASFNAYVTNDSYVSSKFKCYQTYWTFDITKKNAWLGYSTDKSGEHLYCTSYFN